MPFPRIPFFNKFASSSTPDGVEAPAQLDEPPKKPGSENHPISQFFAFAKKHPKASKVIAGCILLGAALSVVGLAVVVPACLATVLLYKKYGNPEALHCPPNTGVIPHPEMANQAQNAGATRGPGLTAVPYPASPTGNGPAIPQATTGHQVGMPMGPRSPGIGGPSPAMGMAGAGGGGMGGMGGGR